MRRYLSKAHRYRHNDLRLTGRTIAAGFFGGTSDDIPVYANAVVNGARCFGFIPPKILQGDVFNEKRVAHFGVQGGGGAPNSIIGGAHSTADLADPAKEPPIGFYFLKGSWFGDWNVTDDFMRATVATPSYGLAAVWFMYHSWRLDTMATGSTLGQAQVDTANDTNQFPDGGSRTLEILGDPSLRVLRVTPPASPAAEVNGTDVRLTWVCSPDQGARYFVYRDSSIDGSFSTRLTATPLSRPEYLDTNAPSGSKIYLIRALLEAVSGSGSYTNLSQGVFVTVN